MRPQDIHIQKHRQNNKKPRGAGGKALRLLLSLLLAVLLVPQVPIYALEGEPAAQQLAQGTSPEITPTPSQEQTAPAVALGAEEATTEEPTAEEAEGAGDTTEQPAEQPADPSAPQEQGAFATLAEAEDAGAISSVPSDPQGYVADEVLVVLAGEGTEADELAAVEESVVELSKTDDATEVELLSASADEDPLALVELPVDVSVADALLQLANDENVAFAQPNYRYTLMDDEFEDSLPEEGELAPADDSSALESFATTVNDPYTKPGSAPDYQWWLGAVKAYEAWDREKVDREVTIAVIDTGARLTHDDLDDNINQDLAWDAYNEQLLSKSVSQGKVPNDGDMAGHGTHVAGIAAAEANNNLLGAGVSYNAKILPINVFYVDSKTKQLVATTVSVRDAFDYIFAHRTEANIRVVNMSFGGYAKEDNDSLLHAKIQTAKNLGILSVCAAGNSGKDPDVTDKNGNTNLNYPSDYEEVIAVTNVQQSGSEVVINESSDHNAYKDIAAPGTSILSTYCRSDTDAGKMSGTSMATPVVSGIAALLFAKNPNLTPDQVKEALCSTATDLGSEERDNYYGYGLVNADAALARLDQRYTVIYAPGDHGTWTAASKTTANLLYGVATPAFSGNTATEHHVGYTFAGWSPTWEPAVMGASATITYTATWSINSYTVTFSPNGGSVSPTSITKTYNSAVGTLPTPTRAGHTFTGWYTAQSGGTKVANTTKVTGNATLYARWSINSYTVTFNPNGGSGPSTSITRTYNSAVGAPRVPTHAGHTFTGWYTAPSGGTLVTPDTKVTGDVIYYARWSINSYTATFNPNGGSVFPANTTRTYNSAIGALPTPTRLGFAFDGWYTAPSGGAKIATGTRVTGNTTYYAHWAANNFDNVPVTISSVLAPSQVFDIPGGSIANCAPIQIYRANTTAAQRFRLERVTNTNYYVIRNIKSNRVLDVSAGKAFNGAVVQQYAANGTAAQKWKLVPATAAANTPYIIVSALNESMVLDLPGAASASGTKLQMYQSNGTNAQRFALNKITPLIVSGRDYTISSALDERMVLDVAGGAKANGANIQIYRSNGTGAQKFQVTYDNATGYYTITNPQAKRLLDVAGAGAGNGTNVHIYQPNGTLAQKWTIVPGPTAKTYVLYAACSGLVLDVAGAGRTNGTNVWTYAFNGTPAQVWTFN